MATIITEECINCGACETECPTQAIAESTEIYLVDSALCCECVGYFDELACAAVCPVDCCVVDTKHPESKEQLLAKARQASPEREFGPDAPSHI
ncbi:MAG: YfhL family 4Fe-4S dicluster ferredoxin [Pseudomonadota bacterium]